MFCNQNPEENICNQNRISQNQLFSNYDKLVNESKTECANDPNNSISCTFMTNHCLLNSESTEYCDQFLGSLYNFDTNTSCIIYRQSYNEILRNVEIPQLFDYSSIIKIVLAAFSPTGEFIGYFPLKKEIQNCGSKMYQGNIWKKFGRNYYETCSLNISQLSLNFYEPFLYIENQDLLIQMPVLPTNYIKNGQALNENGKESEYQFLNRFFLYDNYSYKKTQYASEISFILKVRENNHKNIHVPYLTVKYENVPDSDLIQSFKFSARYLLTSNSFKTATILISLMSGFLAFTYIAYTICVNLRSLVSDKSNQYTIFTVLGIIFDTVGFILFIIPAFLGFYILCNYKWTKHLAMCLESVENYNSIVNLVFASLAFKAVGVMFIFINKSSGTLQVIDWDERSTFANNRSHSRFMSRSRQNVVANEWMKLSTLRGIDTSFIIIFVLLITRGFDMYLFQQPIPTTEKIDVGKKYSIIEIGLTSFTWGLSALVFWILKRFIYWNIIGNPYTNFQHLCLSLNVSALMVVCNTKSFLIHGKQIGRATISQLNNNYDYEYNSDQEREVKSEYEYTYEYYTDYSSYSGYSTNENESEQHKQDSKNSQNSVKLYINSEDSYEQSAKRVTVNNSNSDQTEPQKARVDLNDGESHNPIEKKSTNKSNEIDSRKKIIDEDYKEIDNVGMENFDSDSSKKIKGNGKKGKQKDKSSSEDNKKSDENNDDADVEITIDSDSDSGSGFVLEKTIKKNPNSNSGSNSKKNSDLNADIFEEEEDISEQSKNSKQEESKIILNMDFFKEDEEKNKSSDPENVPKIKIDQGSSSSIKISEDSNPRNESLKPNINAEKDFDSDVVNDNESKASKYIKKFKFKPVNLIEEEDNNDNESTDYDAGLIDEYSHYYYTYSETEKKEFDSKSDGLEEVQNNNTNKNKKGILDTKPKLDPLNKKVSGDNQVFELFLNPSLFIMVNTNIETIRRLVGKNKKTVHSKNAKTISQLKEETNELWRQILINDKSRYEYQIESISILQNIFNIGPVAKTKSFFTINSDASFKETMLYGMEGSLMIFYLVLFLTIEILSNASISGLVVFLVDALVIKLFKWRRRKYLIDFLYSPYKSLVR